MDTSDFGDFEETHERLSESAKTPEAAPNGCEIKPIAAPNSALKRLQSIATLAGSERFQIAPNDPLLAFPVALIPKLKACSLYIGCDGLLVAFTTSRKGFAQAVGAKIPTFLGGEYTVISWAAENDRLWPKDFRSFVTMKSRNPDWRMTPKAAFATMPLANAGAPQWSLGQMLRRVQSELIAVEMYAQ